ncbi:acyl-CoA reductase-like NAD-dependent aldehyde dehydrogenase [Paraburkholderia bannensis]|uniref:Acyl-CoA reductase-like NAD-dependent aldehyde dehydrogenase n=1 Tax=Paraburkholderia bannensis TaxID=765414 RepID=A0A7W9WUZ1_9BURK|nr:aldehyde dehydrogenase family protein [Paraburkholderia sp. WP4_3_2]MBB3259782.1 acyl-CoA reductase-like NAD-dependent aldehyde dehydrogenase [Paraburkholderia sp. WP4_3_2]MBB6104907.1 acyl-CoA reductase-like NAD-dependent aldehyde dehydrogenase [Paraburkholderia bannensis]
MNARHWIAGEWTGIPTIDSIDPATGEAVGQFADGGAIEADAAIAAARHVFDHTAWAQDARLRQDVLLGWAAALEAEREMLATLLTRENGPGIDPATDIGALIDSTTRDAVQRTIERACGMAGRVLLRGTCSGHAFLSPTLVEHSDPKAFFCQDEIFGPFVTLEVFENETEAIDKANDTVFGLSASVWTHDGARVSRRACAAQRHRVDQ